MRRALTVKAELSANRSLVAGLELLEKTAGNLLQELFERLQTRVPLAVLLACVLNRNSGSTIRDVSRIVNKVILSLQMDIDSYSNFVRIYRGDYNESLHQKVRAMKRPLLERFASCALCGDDFAAQNAAICVFACGHSFHAACLDRGNRGNRGNPGEQGSQSPRTAKSARSSLRTDECPICRGKREEVRKKVGLAGKFERQTVKQRLLPETAGIGADAAEKEKEKEKEKEAAMAADEATRWREFQRRRREKEQSSLLFIYDQMGGDQQQLVKLLDPPSSLFSARPDLPEVDPQALVEMPQPGNLPIKPISKGECVLLYSSPYAE